MAHADGELRFWQSAWIKRHLNLCWDCRARLHEIEEEARQVAKALREDTLLGPDSIRHARTRFLVWRDAFEQGAPAAPARSAPAWSRVAAACVLAAALMAGVWSGAKRAEPPASEWIARTRRAEASLYRTPLLIHQVFRVRLKQLQPEVRERAGEIEIWSDSSGRQFSSRWRHSGGELRHAVWRTEAGREYLYNAAVAPGVIVGRAGSASPVRSLGDLPVNSLDLEALESGVIRWIETRQWRPISLSSDLSEFASHDGAILRAERDGQRLCLQAERVSGSRRVELSLEIDPVSHQPRLQRVRFEAEGRVLEVELAAGECEFIESSRLAPNVFEPELPLIAARLPEAPGPRAEAPAVEAGPRAPSGDPAAELEMEALYALHRARACLGEPVTVVRVVHAGGAHVEVRGLVELEARRRELRAALAALPAVKVILRTAEEAIAESAQQAVEVEPEPAPDVPVQLSSRPLPVQEKLDAFFARAAAGGSEPASQSVAQLTTQAISLSQGTLSHAWALRRLAERFGGRDLPLPARSKWLLEVMVRDHGSGLDSGNRRMSELLEPILSPGEARGAVASPSRGRIEWTRASLDLFETASLIDRLVRSLFAGADPPYDAAPGALSTEQSALDLIDAFGRLQSQHASLAAGVTPY